VRHPYQVLGATVPLLLGRRRLLDQLEHHLLKPSPEHVQVVGPTLYGKSVLLHHLAERHRAGSPRYLTTAYADLRHAPPARDADFRRRLAELVRSALAAPRPALAEALDLDDAGIHELLDLVLEELAREGVCLLVVLDGFDHVLAGTGLTRNLWDQLRALAQKRSLRLVTGSRRPLRELCKSEESRTSDFWEIFYDTPVAVGPFAEADWDDLLAPFAASGIAVDVAAREALAAWSGGVPVLAAALLEAQADCEDRDGPTVNGPAVDAIATAVLAERRLLLAALWDDCGVELQGDLAELATHEGKGIPSADLTAARQRRLAARGFSGVCGGRIHSACRLLARYALEQAPSVADLTRLFGSREGFERNVRSLLELRLAQVATPSTDPELLHPLEAAVRELSPHPELALHWVRGIAGRALILLWNAELGPEQRFPEDWIAEWNRTGVHPQWLDGSRRLPRKLGAQCGALRLITGVEHVRPLARFATKPTALLIDALQSVGDFGQHRENFPESRVTAGFAAAMVLTAIELLDSVNADLARGR